MDGVSAQDAMDIRASDGIHLHMYDGKKLQTLSHSGITVKSCYLRSKHTSKIKNPLSLEIQIIQSNFLSKQSRIWPLV